MRQNTISEQSKLLRQKVAILLGGKCEVCHRKYSRGFAFHHKSYVEGEKSYRDFTSSIRYNMYICPKIIKEPDRFALLCQAHHHVLENLKRWKPDKLDRLIKLAKESM